MDNELYSQLKRGSKGKLWGKPKAKITGGGLAKKRKTVTAKEDTEAYVTKEIVRCAWYHNQIRLWRQQAGKVKIGPYYMQLAPKGAADLTGILSNGTRLEVEVKRRHGGVQSKDQKEWQKYIEAHNGVYIVAHSAEEFQSKLEKAKNDLSIS
jgi:hypothetical protein